METEMTENLMPRDLLEKSNCCRFCSLGGTGRPEFNVSFIQIFAESDMLNLNERLDLLINRYLPLKVYQTDLHFPKVICSTCYYSLEETIQFFDKISAGQKILMKIINQNKIIESKSRKDIDYSYSDDNPLLQPPRRRGRPRKDPNKPKEKPIPLDTSPTATPKPKRQSRPPVRYTTDCTDELLDTDRIKEEPEETENIGDPDVSDYYLTFQPNLLKTDVPMSLEALESQTEVTGLTTNSLFGVEKLDIIMDGDEEIEAGQLQSTLKDSQVERIYTENFVEVSVTSPTETSTLAKMTSLDQHQELPDDSVSIIEVVTSMKLKNRRSSGEDSDASVRTIDIIQNRRKRRKKKKVKRLKMRRGVKVVVKCQECDKEFGHKSSLLYHRAVTHDTAPKKHICLVCEKAFSHKSLLSAHSFTHSEERCFKCDECILKFKSKASLYTHKKSVHSEKKQYTCDKCGGQFNLKSSLNAHLRIHTGEKPYSCEFCEKTFAQRSNMREHRRIHTGERPYKCPSQNCEKAFTTASQLRSHKLTHNSGPKPFLCSICGKGFTHGENFKYHLRRHAGDHRLACSECPKRFVEPWSLKKHGRCHTGERPYTCDVCKKGFADPSNFAKHKRIHQGGQEGGTSEQTSTLDPLFPDVQNEADSVQGEQSLTERLIAAGMHVVDTTDSSTIGSDGSMVRVLNTEGLESLDSGDGTQQFIYVYPEDLPMFTITLHDGQQSIEVRAGDENTLQTIGNLASSGPITFATMETGESQQYYKLQTFNGSTSFVPMIESEVTGGESQGGSSLELSTNESEILVNRNQNEEEHATTLVTLLHIQGSQGITTSLEGQNEMNSDATQ